MIKSIDKKLKFVKRYKSKEILTGRNDTPICINDSKFNFDSFDIKSI